MSDILRDVVSRNRNGEAAAIPSVCTAHPDALRASLLMAEDLDRAVVIEATSNQVNQFGGYTGMTPADFIGFVHRIADAEGIDRARIVFGGDHLGPQVWRKGPADEAMSHAHRLVADYVRAGFDKIHLDCSEGCAGEAAQVDDETSAARAAALARSCRAAASDPDDLVFVIGTEVPPPGGAREDDEGEIAPTTPESAAATLRAHQDAFDPADFACVAGLVVQPGVEFAPMSVHHLPAERDPGLRAIMLRAPGVVLEAHSTDYQRAEVYPRLAELGFAFQKVGPALTFAYRQAIYALDLICEINGIDVGARIRPTMEALMRNAPDYWSGHYHGDGQQIQTQLHFGLADRIRYYWPQRPAAEAVGRLTDALEGRSLPFPLLLQVFAPEVIERAEGLRASRGLTQVDALVLATIQTALAPYFFDWRKPEASHDA